MTNPDTTPTVTRASRLILVIAFAAGAAIGIRAQAEAASLPPGSITFTIEAQMLHKPMPLYRLSRTAPPTAFVAQTLGGTRGMAMEGTRLVARDDAGTMRAYVDGRSGEAQVFPELTSSGAPARPSAIAAVAKALFARTDLIPKDATTTALGDPNPVMAAQAAKTPDGRSVTTHAPQVLFTYMQAIRYAGGLQVFGDGSQATIGIGNDGSVRALVRRWQAASVAGSVLPTTTPAQLMHAIDAQLVRFASRDAAITVDRIVPAYYDGNRNYLQPVYEFEATIHTIGNGAADEGLRGFVPAGKVVEPVPAIGDFPQAAPPVQAPASADGHGGAGRMVSQIALGQYANQDGTMQGQANAYLSGFQSVTPGEYGPPINRVQWYYAQPYLMLSSANSYINSMNVGYTMPHGNWWWNSTDGRNDDPWKVSQIGTGGNPGYGSASGGKMTAWIIDSCEVIPSYYDLQYTTGDGNTAFNNWWPVFQGLHRALGFRTEMLLGETTMNYNIAQAMAEGASADDAFINGVAAVSFGTYTDSHLKLSVHWDRVSIMHDPRNYNETIYATGAQSASGALNNVWFGN
jgi:Family of unknown function (DUF6345)